MGYDIISYGKMVKTKTRLGCEKLCMSVKGKLEGQDMTDHQGGEL